ncbi:hypothetical protein KIPB_014526 [Kipferlia bialata]|uniref:Uncharacterized protein n=1 Tax=Kipferlia bialata TaxID=797122 RepID=A0A391P2K7_9EUKA|nr:hypothetical protein KIPB_014526 [Kipferlia bialata]|eukprot:g14526.t1
MSVVKPAVKEAKTSEAVPEEELLYDPDVTYSSKGEELYRKGLALKQQWEAYRTKARIDQEYEEKAVYTFKPTIAEWEGSDGNTREVGGICLLGGWVSLSAISVTACIYCS